MRVFTQNEIISKKQNPNIEDCWKVISYRYGKKIGENYYTICPAIDTGVRTFSAVRDSKTAVWYSVTDMYPEYFI